MTKKFCKKICDEIIINYSNGMPLKYAAELAGVHPSTVTKWRKKGEEDETSKYHQFYLDMKKAKANYIIYHLNFLNNSKSDSTHRYLLSIADPEYFTPSNKIEHTGDVKVKENIEIDEKLLDEIIKEKKNQYGEITDKCTKNN